MSKTTNNSNFYALQLDTHSRIKDIRNEFKRENKCCSVSLGVLVKKRIIYKPAKNGCEILALLHASDPQLGYWYLHGHYNEQKDCYIIAIVRAVHFIDAPLIELAFERFNYWIKERGYYTLPYYVSDITDEEIKTLPDNELEQKAFYEVEDFERALFCIQNIICEFAVPIQFPLSEYSDTTENLFPECLFSQETKLKDIYATPKPLADNIFQPFPLSPGIDEEYICCLLEKRKWIELSLKFKKEEFSNIDTDA